MKYAVVIGDGMADDPRDELGGKTPLEAARTPHMDAVAAAGVAGLVETIPPGVPPGSTAGCLSVFGCDPTLFFRGRGPFEAAARGVEVGDGECVFRCNLVSLDADGAVLADYSAGHISTEDAAEVIAVLNGHWRGERFRWHCGVGYRHIFAADLSLLCGRVPACTPPHDITGRVFAPHLPRGKEGALLRHLAAESRVVLKDVPVNRRRRKNGKPAADMVWFWGGGVKPDFVPYARRFGLSGGVISAVDLVRGIGILAGLSPIDVPGITGYYDTDYGAKSSRALRALRENDIVFVHVEAPDEASHEGDTARKVETIERFDADVVGPLAEEMVRMGEYRLLVLPDHFTPLAVRTHRGDPVPAAMCGTGITPDAVDVFTENAAARGVLCGVKGWDLVGMMTGGKRLGRRPGDATE